jgi:hypothetical protein
MADEQDAEIEAADPEEDMGSMDQALLVWMGFPDEGKRQLLLAELGDELSGFLQR